MVDCQKLCSNLNFWLKLVSWIFLGVASDTFFANQITYAYLGNSNHILLALLIAYIFLKTTKLVEIYLLGIAFVTAVIGIIVYLINGGSGGVRGLFPISYPVAVALTFIAIIAMAVDIVLRYKKDNSEEAEDLPQQ